MSKNLIKSSEVRKALISGGNVQPSQGLVDSVTFLQRKFNSKNESQAAAIAARRKELGIKPITSYKGHASQLPPVTNEGKLFATEHSVIAEADRLITQSLIVAGC